MKEFTDKLFTTDGKVLLCRPCNTQITAEKRSQVLQHLKTSKHIEAVEKKGPVQTMLQTTGGGSTPRAVGRQNQFWCDLCSTLLAADIPFYKLSNPVLCQFLEKYTGNLIPHESTLRKNYLPNCYSATLDTIRKSMENKKIWLSVDETTDSANRAITNVLVGSLDRDFPSKSYLLHLETLEKVNHSTIAQVLERSLHILWPEEVKNENVLLLVTDAAPYMIKAAKGLQVLYPKMLHVTCMAHALHRVAEEVRASSKAVDKLISDVKKVFLKAPSRIVLFKEKQPNLPLPPSPVVTRWGTWINAAIYYAENFEAIKEIVDTFDADDAACIEAAQNDFKTTGIQEQLAHIASNFACLADAIKKLEAKGSSIVEAMDVVEDLRNKLQSSEKSSMTQIRAAQKLLALVKKNPGYSSLKQICDILSGKDSSMKDLHIPYSVHDITLFKYAPIVSCDVERSFSRYKSVLQDNRLSFEIKNLAMYMICHLNM